MPFSDVADAAACLKPPKAPAEYVSPLKPLNDIGDLISPAAWLSELLEIALGKNPMEEAQRHFGGDWEAYATSAEAWHNLGRACSAMARNLESGNVRLSATWQGCAADAAFQYFDTLRRKLQGVASSLDAMRVEYETVAQGVWAAAEMVAQILATIVDLCATWAICAAAGTAMSWTGWGAAVGYGVGALQAVKVIERWDEATEWVNKSQLVVNASCGVLARLGGELAAQLNTFPLPRDGYDHPAV
ncbi:hypothetical protein [Streptomyces sp. URMC 123]|uniref:hypothetical protein n=1 Tax=Streptomyces sp. URMC 123 TaxID=3423403 RepID=UPI003F1D7FFD